MSVVVGLGIMDERISNDLNQWPVGLACQATHNGGVGERGWAHRPGHSVVKSSNTH